MESLFEIVLANAGGATLLAGLAWLVTRRVSHPAVHHVLWLLVLVELVSPPVLVVRLLPETNLRPLETAIVVPPPDPIVTARLSPTGLVPHGPAGTTTPAGRQAAAPSPRFALPSRATVGRALLGTAAAGTVALLVATLVGALRFRRRLRSTHAPSPELLAEAELLARRLGLRRVPEIRVTDAAVPPLLWPSRRGLVVLPQRLLDDLSRTERGTLIAHELAHAKRRDHWIRPLELLVVALYWWHPIVWWARARLRVAEEKCCDALVLALFPGRARAYAESLLKTLEFRAVPRLATGAADPSRLKERMTMIMNEAHPAPLAERFRLPLVAAALLTLLVSPSWTPRGDVRAAVREEPIAPEVEVHPPHDLHPLVDVHPLPDLPAVPAPEVSAVPLPLPVRRGNEVASVAPVVPGQPVHVMTGHEVPEEHIEALLAIRRHELELQKQMQEVHAKQMAVQHQIREVEIESEKKRLEEEIARLVAEGLRDEAATVERELRRHLHDAELEMQRARLESELSAKEAALHMEMRTLELEFEEGRSGEENRKMQEQMLRLEREMQALQVERMEAELEMSRERLAREQEELQRLTEEESKD